MIGVTKRAANDAERFLFFKGGAVFEPAFKSMTLGTDKVISNHGVEIPPPAPGLAFIWETIFIHLPH
jgi:hypothetical protein